MKHILLLTLLLIIGVLACVGGVSIPGRDESEQPRMGTAGMYILPNAAKELPLGVPKNVDTNGDVVDVPVDFTTRSYQTAALDLMLRESSQVAKDLQLPEELPIEKTNLTGCYIDEFGYSYIFKAFGNITTKSYAYYFSVGNKLSYVNMADEAMKCRNYSTAYSWPVSQIDTNLAYQQATQWLSAAHMDVAGLNRDGQLYIQPDNANCYAPPGKFVPVYDVFWKQKNGRHNSMASVMVCTPTKTLVDLRVEYSKYILRAPLVFSNLAALFPGVAPVVTNRLVNGGSVTPANH